MLLVNSAGHQLDAEVSPLNEVPLCCSELCVALGDPSSLRVPHTAQLVLNDFDLARCR